MDLLREIITSLILIIFIIYSEENANPGDIYACKFNKNNNDYVDLPTKEYEDFYMKMLENSSAENPIDIEESDNDESLDDDDDDELKLLSTVKSINLMEMIVMII